jgi:hypothetical protein
MKGPVETRFGRSERDSEREGNLRQWQVEIVVQDDQGSGFRFEPGEPALELIAVDRDGVGVVAVGRVDRSQVDVEAVAPQAARLIDTGADEQAVEPRVEAAGVTEGREVAPGSDERLLDGILGLIGVPEDEPRGSIQPEDRGGRKRGEGVMIASSRSLHDVVLHFALGGGAAGLDALIEYGETTPRDRSEFGRGPGGALPSPPDQRPRDGVCAA